ncbi:MAG: response regulator [Ignavibacteriaceae bacterium]|nr:response regulator [Ignavibacteriaceae bacterium]
MILKELNVAESQKKMRILIIEDNIESQLILKVYLRELYLVDIAEDAESGLNFLKSSPYDLILLDINLPGKLNGEDVLKEVRNDILLKKLPVVVITAYALKGDKERFLNQGASDYLSKPVEKQMLRDTISKHLP